MKLVDDIARLSQILTKWKELTRGAEIAKGRDAPRIIMDTLRTRRTQFTGESAKTRRIYTVIDCVNDAPPDAKEDTNICRKIVAGHY